MEETTGHWRTIMYYGDEDKEDLIMTTQDNNIAMYSKECGKRCDAHKVAIAFDETVPKYEAQ